MRSPKGSRPTSEDQLWCVEWRGLTKIRELCTVSPHLSEHLGTKGWLDMRNVQITETGVNTL